MSFVFQNFQVVPSRTVEAIGNKILEVFMKNLPLKMDGDEIEYLPVIAILNESIKSVVSDSIVTTDGFSLDDDQVGAIACRLRNGERINAIKDFRSMTGCDLKKAKDFIDKFGIGESASIKFKLAFSQ
jgi:hypothetical protein